MSTISDLVLQNIDSISEAYALNITEPSRLLQLVSRSIREDGEQVCSFDRIDPVTDRSLIAVDGGNASEQLSGGDLIVVGATVGEGLSSKQLFDNLDDYPVEVFNNIIPHTSGNDRIEKAVRSALELRVLEKTVADIKIIDGAYLGNLSTVLFALLDHDPVVSNTTLELEWYDADGLLKSAMRSLLKPLRDNSSRIIAVAKSDSSRVYAKQLLEPYDLKINITDRLLASRLLLPGEFLKPRSIESNPALIATLTKSLGLPGFGENSSNRKLLVDLLQDKAGLFTRMGKAGAEEEILWTTYFKPTLWSEYSKVVKIEFTFYGNDEEVVSHARKLVQLVDQDIIDEAVLEPWCQYQADRRAKDVSNAINLVKNHLLEMVENPAELSGLIRGYRT